MMWYKLSENEYINLSNAIEITTWGAIDNKFFVKFIMVSGENKFSKAMPRKKAIELIRGIIAKYETK